MTLADALREREQNKTSTRIAELVEILQPEDKPYRGLKPSPSGPDMKVCGSCWQELPKASFQRQASARDGYRPTCPACNSAAASKSSKRRHARNELLGMAEAGLLPETFPWHLIGGRPII